MAEKGDSVYSGTGHEHKQPEAPGQGIQRRGGGHDLEIMKKKTVHKNWIPT